MKDEYKPSFPIAYMDEAENFDSASPCFKCAHLIHFMHTYTVYKADEEGEPDITVWKCKEKDCKCISIIPINKS